ncbi:MAG: polysaccharide biosynthesis C-terminal domain-containing protein [Bacteroidota bacterium]|nr:polysaccharide biosynthesis C-terminal domain-containing protein [Bacteroidota bacterium]
MLKSLMKDSVMYGIANAIQKLVPFFVVPIVIHQLGQTALKVYDISFVYAYLFSWLIILGQDAAASVFYFDTTKTSFNKKQVLGYAFFVQWAFLFLFAFIVFPFKNNIAGLLFSDDPTIGSYWVKALLIIPGHILLNYVLNILLWQRRKREYIILCICQTLASLASVYTIVVILKGDISSLFYCLIGSTTVCGLIGLGIINKEILINPLPLNKPLLKKLIFFGVPFALTSFFHQLLPSIDRYFLLHYGQQEDLPQYILAVKLGGLISMGIGAFALAFTPYSMAKLNEDGAEKELSSLFHIVAVAGFILIPVLLLFKDVLVHVFADASFSLSTKLLPFFFFGWMFDLFSYFSMLGIYKGQNSMLVLILFGSSIILVSLLNIILIPRTGVYGAAIAFCITKAVLFFIPLIYLRRHFKLKVDGRSFIAAGSVAIGCSWLLYQVEWYTYCFILVLVIGAAAYYLYNQFRLRILFITNNQNNK